MAVLEKTLIKNSISLIPELDNIPTHTVMHSYDKGADVLYVSYGFPKEATNSVIGDDDIIIRYKDDEIIGFTILHASKRKGKLSLKSLKQENE